jgi:colanic acid biosynthesis glycosyl transferase WcaI
MIEAYNNMHPLPELRRSVAGLMEDSAGAHGHDGERRLRVLIHGINYAPELTGIGKYTSELAEWLAQRGHAVRVVTAPPYYPDWRVRSGYSARRYAREQRNGVTVQRCPLWVPHEPSGLRRMMHLATFAASSAPLVAGACLWRPDAVLAIEPTMLCAPAAWLLARVSGAKAWLHVQDFEFDAALSLGMLPAKLAAPVRSFERTIMGRFDRVSSISDSMVELLLAKGVKRERALLFPNWVDCTEIHPLGGPSRLRAELGIAPRACVALYSGNMGEKQGLELAIDAARSLAGVRDLVFLFCGNGSSRPRLEARAAGLPNVRWLALQPAARLNALLNAADIHLLPQRADAADLVMPSKLTGMLASGRPIVATAHPATQLARVVETCGVATPPGDVRAFASAVYELQRHPIARHALGAAARCYAEQNLHKEAVLGKFERALLSCVAAQR